LRKQQRNKTCMFDIFFQKCTLSSATEIIIEQARQHKRGLIVTPNVDHIITNQNDAELHEIYQRASLITADGMPLVWLSRLLPMNNSLPERVTGSDLLFSVCQMAEAQHLSVGFIGAQPGVVEKAKNKLCALHPKLDVLITHSPPFGFEKNTEQSMKIIELCQTMEPDILFFGVGCPKQEKWCDKHLDQLNTGPIICVGAAFDFAAGKVNRAPNWMRTSGLEWVYRLIQEPGRLWKRYLIKDSLFLYYAIKELCIAWGNRIRQH